MNPERDELTKCQSRLKAVENLLCFYLERKMFNNMEFPLSPSNSCQLTFRHDPTKAEVDQLTKFLELIRTSAPEKEERPTATLLRELLGTS